ncbi:DNA polymerase alpha catalytic subunit-like isoform X2 [Dioscorea cayenensis subsp. rotundata]|uniref:DNA polymerase n=1 Tax=Dioscorea cayennensis subsp. rotundata TaxID=55577 RepID=A0AB40ALB5_DIOCR|nr:DNA polymerase alpha catalytic subunit-like isoform X2 [Dioscorea cayenensis subsp. rotundata]
MKETTAFGRRTRNRRPKTNSRAEALERLKAIRKRRSDPSGAAPSYQIKMEAPIFDTVPEEEYAALMVRHREETRDFIVDDDGLGYADEDLEEEWSRPPDSFSSDEGYPPSNDGLKPRNKWNTKKEPIPKKPQPSSLSAALVGKESLPSMFTSSVFKKYKRTKGMGLPSDNIVDEVLAEFAPDETDREESRRRHMIYGGRCSFTPAQNSSELPLAAADQKKDDQTELVKEEEVLGPKLDSESSGRVAEMKDVNEEIKAEAAGSEIVGLGALLDSDGSLPFYVIDASEEPFGANAGTLYLFGKVKEGTTYQSCCVVVKNMKRCVYAVPNGAVFPSSKIMEFEENIANSKASPADFHTTLQEMAAGLKSEVTKRLRDLNVFNFSMMIVKRNYAFERTDIPRGEQYVLKINYPFKDPPLQTDLKGEHFLALLGTNSSALELFLIKRKIKGPCWLWISRFACCLASQKVSWCKYEVVVDCPKDLHVSVSKGALEIPPVIAAAINLKTIIGEKHTMNEIVSGSIICCHKAKIDSPMSAEELERPGMLSIFTAVRHLGGIFPMGFVKEADDRNSEAGSTVLALESSERALLNRLAVELHKLDCDVLVGHNISGFDLDIFLHRAQVCKVPNAGWSRIGRLKRSVMPKLMKENSRYGFGPSPGIMSCIAGRLLCDTNTCSQDLLREVSYSLTQLAESQLKKDRKEIAPLDVPAMFRMSSSLFELVDCGENDARLSLELMFHLNVLPLTRQLTNISGNLWGKTLLGARAQRVEYLLLHSFHAKKYMVPDKNSARNKEINTTKRRINVAAEGGDDDNLNVDSMPPEGGDIKQGKGKKGPAYAGGLVLEPKKGLYDKYVLLLDFNSLYPSIIQEFNICFTTVEHSSDGTSTNLSYLVSVGVLPEVIYGDTDSIMIYTGLDDINKAKTIAAKVIQEVNKKYGCLEIDLDGLYKRMLLLKKKKYAAVEVQSENGIPKEVIDCKGVDIVRRDWCELSKDIGNFCLKKILSERSCEDVVELIHSYLVKEQEQIRKGEIQLEKYVIWKTLTKPPEDYLDAKNQPHVQVALRLKQNGYPGGFAGDTVPYVICCQRESNSGSSTGIAQRARHLDELNRDSGNWLIDINYYLSQQIYPVVSRLCASIQGTSPGRLADCLGLDSSKYQYNAAESAGKGSIALLSVLDDDKRYSGCVPLRLSCPRCSSSFDCPPVSSLLSTSSNRNQSGSQSENEALNFWRTMRCPRCPGDVGCRFSPAMIANQVKRQADGFTSKYYRGLMMCDDELCKHTTGSINLRVIGDAERGTVCPNYPSCNGHLIRQYTEADLYKQFSYFCYILDSKRFLEKLELKNRAPFEKKLAAIRPAVEQPSSVIHKIRNRCAYAWVSLGDLSVSI